MSDFEIPNFYDDEFAIGESKENTENLIIKNKKVKNVYGSEYDDEPEYEET